MSKQAGNPSLLIPISTGMSLRNLLCTDLHTQFVREGLAPRYLVPDALRRETAAQLGPEDHPVGSLPAVRQRSAEFVLREAVFAGTMRRHRLRSVEIRREYMAKLLGGESRSKRVLERLAGPSRALQTVLERIRVAAFRFPEFGPVFDGASVGAVFSNNLFSMQEAGLLRCARSRGVMTIGMVHSWDNPTNKGGTPFRPDLVLVWSRVMAREMIDIHEFPASRIRIVGTPQFDVYAGEAPLSRKEVMDRLRLPPEYRLVLYASGAPGHCKDEPRFASMLARLTEGEDERIALLVRLHPRDRAERYHELADRARVRIELPGRQAEGVYDRWSPNREDHLWFASLMRHADVVVNLASTVALDAACNDTPIVHVAFDADGEKPYLDSIRRLFDYDHTVRLMSVGASLTARSEEELVAAVRRSLAHPEEKREERRLLALQEGYDGRGGSARRIAETVRTAIHG